MNAESDTSTVCPDSVDSCVSPVLKVSVCFKCILLLLCCRLLCKVYLRSLHLNLLVIKDLTVWTLFHLIVVVPWIRLVFVCVVFVIAL